MRLKDQRSPRARKQKLSRLQLREKSNSCPAQNFIPASLGARSTLPPIAIFARNRRDDVNH